MEEQEFFRHGGGVHGGVHAQAGKGQLIGDIAGVAVEFVRPFEQLFGVVPWANLAVFHQIHFHGVGGVVAGVEELQVEASVFQPGRFRRAVTQRQHVVVGQGAQGGEVLRRGIRLGGQLLRLAFDVGVFQRISSRGEAQGEDEQQSVHGVAPGKRSRV